MRDKQCNRKRRFKPALPLSIMGNVRSVCNKMEEEIAALTRSQWEYCESTIMCFLGLFWNGDLAIGTDS